jgi:hypothetical protein
VGHLVVDFIFILLSPFFAPPIPAVRGNPFVTSDVEKEKKEDETPRSET